MTSRTCCVPKCESHRKHIRLHEVPSRRQPRSRIKWIMAILSNFPDINTEESERLKSSKWQFVCHKHFEKKFVNSTMRLRNGCFPTLFTEREIATGVPNVDPKTLLQETTRIATIDHMYYTIQKIHIDHTYSKTHEDEDAWMDHLPFPTKSGNLPTDTADADAAASRDAQSALQEDEPAFEEDNNQTESDSRLPKDEVMIDYIIEHPASPGRDIFETIEPEDPKKETVFSWEKMELLETDDPEDEVLVPETKIPEDPPTLSLFCEEPDKPPVGTPSKPEAAVVPEDVVYRCVDCAVVVDGFTFWCVQCLCGVMCGACAAMSPHDIHYVLRAPKGATLSQTQPVLLVIREQLQKENLLTLYGTDVDGVKVEVKLEPEEPLSPPAPTPPPDLEDPLAIEPHSEVGESQPEPVEPHSKAVQLHMELEHENVESHSEAVHSVEGVETQSEAVQFYVEGAEDPEELQTAAVQIFHEGVEPQSEAVQFYLEGEEPHIEEPQPVQISLEGVEHQSEAVQFYLDGVEPHPEAVQFYLEAVERGTDAVLLQVESTAPGTEVELHHEAVRPDNEARELRLDAIVEKRVNKETVDHHHPFKRPRLMDIRPGDKLYPTTSPKVSDVQNQTLRRIPPTIISQTVFRLPNTIPSSRTGSQILQKIQPSDLRQSKTLSKSSPTELLVPQNVHKGPNILRRPKALVEVGKSALSKQDKVQNIAKGSPLIRTQQINPRGSALQVPQNVGFSELKVTSGPKRYETVIVNSDDDVEFLDEVVLDWNDSENEVESRLDKENQDENRIGKELVGDIESELVKDDLEDRIDRLDKGNRDDDSSDDSAESKDSSKDKESEIDDDDLDEDFRIDEQDRIDEDSTDETDSVEGVVRRTRHTRNTTVGSQRKMFRTPSDAVVQLQRLTSLDIRNWTARSKSRRKD
ncbi:uncharacterized protein LOC134801453 isoform X2 [Cydia splendana]|uniref:uncharacterized protein LOC134801453 isoform X2 n=1 Tax=Cydia splendana TaxID=1100963 RepID=UPI00300C0D55